MFAKVLWVNTGEESIVECSKLKNVGRGVKALWGNSWYKVKIIEKNEDKEYLEALEVAVDGSLMREDKKENKLKESMAEDLLTGNEDVKAASAKVLPANSANLMNMKAVHDALDSKDEQAASTANVDESELAASASNVDESKIELLPGTGVWIDQEKLEEILMKYRGKGKEMTRRLMREILGKKRLVKMTPTGYDGKEAITHHILYAVFRYVNENVVDDEQLSWKDYRRTLTLMCNILRNPHVHK